MWCVYLALSTRKDTTGFSLDTGRLHPQTYQFIEKSANTTRLKFELLAPTP